MAERGVPISRDDAALAELLPGPVEADPSGAAQAALNRAAGTLDAELGTEAARHTAADGNPDEVLAALRQTRQLSGRSGLPRATPHR